MPVWLTRTLSYCILLLHIPQNQLWHAYLTERRVSVRGLRLDHPSVEALNNTFERALVSMHKMPRIWLEYLEILMEQKLVTVTRRVFDRALAALPITQHDRLWAVYLVSPAPSAYINWFCSCHVHVSCLPSRLSAPRACALAPFQRVPPPLLPCPSALTNLRRSPVSPPLQTTTRRTA